MEGEQAVRSVAGALAAGTLSIEQADARMAAVYEARSPQERARLTADLQPPEHVLLPQIAAVTGVSFALILLWAVLPGGWFWPVVPIAAMVAALVTHVRRGPHHAVRAVRAVHAVREESER